MKKPSIHWYPRYHGDYARDTSHLSMMEHGAYTLLLDHYYANAGLYTGPGTKQGAFAGTNAPQLYRVCRATTREEQQAVDSVIEQFFPIINGRHTNLKADSIIEKHNKISKVRSKAQSIREARKSGAHAPTNAGAHALQNQNQNHIDVVVDARGVKKQISILVGAEDDPRWYGNLQRIDQWLANGWDPELDIYPTIKVVMSKRTAPPQSAKYFEQAIADAHAKRTNPQPLPKGNPSHGTHQPTRQQRIDDALDRAWTSTEHQYDGKEKTALGTPQTELLDVQPVRKIPRRP